jgi:hypothetical protein
LPCLCKQASQASTAIPCCSTYRKAWSPGVDGRWPLTQALFLVLPVVPATCAVLLRASCFATRVARLFLCLSRWVLTVVALIPVYLCADYVYAGYIYMLILVYIYLHIRAVACLNFRLWEATHCMHAAARQGRQLCSSRCTQCCSISSLAIQLHACCTLLQCRSCMPCGCVDPLPYCRPRSSVAGCNQRWRREPVC